MNTDEILKMIDESYINKHILVKHDEARLRFTLESGTARDQADFNAIITRYVQHHHQFVGEGQLSEGLARGEAVLMLQRAFQENPHEEGYNNAMYQGLHGHMLDVINELHRTLRNRAFEQYLESVFVTYVNPLSAESIRAFRQGYFDRYRQTLEAAGYREENFELSPRAIFDYHRKTFSVIAGIGRSGGAMK